MYLKLLLDHLSADIAFLAASVHWTDGFKSSVINTPRSFSSLIVLSLTPMVYILEHKRLYNPTRVNFFTNRVVNNWNSLPEYIVGLEAGSLNIFKNSLDRLWSNQDLLYNYRGVIKKKDIF